jgi:CheY-like chemotaxis protein
MMKNFNRVFLVDDDEIFTYVIKKIMEDMYNLEDISVLKNGSDAINKIIELKEYPTLLPDLILLDLSMPVLDGWGFLTEYQKHISTLSKKIEIIVYTSSINPPDMKRAKEYSFVKDYMVKPVEKESTYQFIKKVSEILS